MERIRVIYSKSKDAVYFDNKDLICIFKNSLKRAGIVINYIDNNPDFTFAYPVSIGIESVYEIIDVVILEKLQIPYFIKQLNSNLPTGITCLFAEYIDLNAKSIEMSVFASVYVINFLYDSNELENMTKMEIKELKEYNIKKMKEYLDGPHILVPRKNDKMLEKIDIKNSIKDYSILLDGSIEITVDTGIRGNFKIDYIMLGFIEYINKDISYQIKRTKILYK